MSQLIDSFSNTSCEIGGKWWIAKPMLLRPGKHAIKTKLQWAWEILTGKAIAVHFKEDEGD